MICRYINLKVNHQRLADRLFLSNLRHLKTTTVFRKDPHKLQNVQQTSSNIRTEFTRAQLRNTGIVAHINAGKTTTTERILYHAGSTQEVGDVDRGNTVTDYLIQERDRGITITSAAVSYVWNKHQVNLIDTPGHVDFTIEVERSLAVLDGAVTILDASAGVEAQTITVWNQASKYKLPNIILLNKYDKPLANYLMCMKDIKHMGINASLVQLPVKYKEKNTFNTIIDIVDRNCLHWKEPINDHGSRFLTEPLCDTKIIQNNRKQYEEQVEQEREKLINFLVDIDDKLADHVLSECEKISDVTSGILNQAIRRATLSCQLSPVLVGSSFKCIGVQQLMDAMVNYLPSPEDRERQIKNLLDEQPIESVRKSNNSCGFIFKTMHEKRLGSLTYLRVCNGSFSKLQRVKVLENDKNEQIKKIYRPFADELKEIEKPVEKDDIVVVTGLLEAKTGDIIVDQNFRKEYNDVEQDCIQKTIRKSDNLDDDELRLPFQLLNKQIYVPKINQMEPVYFCTIESLNSAQQIKLEYALACLQREDPSFKFEVDQLGITTIRGMGKLHLEVIRDRIESEYGINPSLGPLQISYRETVMGSATEELSINRLINSANNTLYIKVYIRPKAEGGAWTSKQLRLDTSGESSLGKLRGDHRKAIEQGFMSAMTHGPLKGFPVIDCDILLLDFTANGRCGLPLISSCASQCLTNAIQRSSPTLLEPIMLLEVVSPSEYNNTILSDLTGVRRSIILSTTARSNNSIVVRSHTPLAALSDYSEFLRVTTSGRASFSMKLHTYNAMSDADKQSVTR